MIIGIGNDITECARIQAVLEKHGQAFLDHLLTAREQAAGSRIEYYAGRWAAKEAIAKALGCGIGGSCAFTDIEILNDEAGKPQATLSGAAQRTAAELHVGHIHLSISHEKHYAAAVAVLESLRPAQSTRS